MYLEYDWAFGVYRPRFGRDTFISVGGFRSFTDLDEAKWVLARHSLKLGRKTDTRTWIITNAERKWL